MQQIVYHFEAILMKFVSYLSHFFQVRLFDHRKKNPEDLKVHRVRLPHVSLEQNVVGKQILEKLKNCQNGTFEPVHEI